MAEISLSHPPVLAVICSMNVHLTVYEMTHKSEFPSNQESDLSPRARQGMRSDVRVASTAHYAGAAVLKLPVYALLTL